MLDFKVLGRNLTIDPICHVGCITAKVLAMGYVITKISSSWTFITKSAKETPLLLTTLAHPKIQKQIVIVMAIASFIDALLRVMVGLYYPIDCILVKYDEAGKSILSYIDEKDPSCNQYEYKWPATRLVAFHMLNLGIATLSLAIATTIVANLSPKALNTASKLSHLAISIWIVKILFH